MSTEGERVGILTVENAQTVQSWTDRKTGFTLKTGDPVLEISLLEKPPGPLRTEATKSLHQLADYIAQLPVKPEVILALTYQKMSRFSSHFGFQVADIDLPPKVIENEIAHREQFEGFNGKIPQEVLLIYQKTDDILLKYKKTP